VFKIALPVAFAMNLLGCAIYMALFVYISFNQIVSRAAFLLFNSFVSCDKAFNPESVDPPVSARPDQVEKVLKTCYQYHDANNKFQGRELDLLIVILPDNNEFLYGW